MNQPGAVSSTENKLRKWRDDLDACWRVCPITLPSVV
jgi:hypothetical protein